MEFNESKLKFTFQDEKWWVVKFDDNIDYTKVTKNLKETKGVDFVGIYNSENLFFFEIKNLRGHTMDIQSQARLANGAEDLTTEIAQKVKDSLACILGASRNSTNNSEKWRDVCNLISTNQPFRIIAWIEEDISQTPYKIKKSKVDLSIRNNKLKNKLNWLTSSVFIESIKERQCLLDGLSIDYL